MREAGCYYILCKNTCVCEVNKLERRFYLVDAQVPVSYTHLRAHET